MSRIAPAAFAIAACLAALPLGASAKAQLRLGTPDTIEMIEEVTGARERGCGLRADYQFPESVIRVEMLASRATSGITFSMQAFSPTTVTPPMRDIWLRTPTYFTVGMFSAGRLNAKGFIEARGSFDADAAKIVLAEIAEGRAEISLVFEGMLPYSRVPIALPRPLPDQVKTAFQSCSDLLAG
jgi:hypothetical protein